MLSKSSKCRMSGGKVKCEVHENLDRLNLCTDNIHILPFYLNSFGWQAYSELYLKNHNLYITKELKNNDLSPLNG